MDGPCWRYEPARYDRRYRNVLLGDHNLAHCGAMSSGFRRTDQQTTHRAYTMNSDGEGNLRSHQSGTKALPSATTHVALVRRLFPNWGEEISRLVLCNETFRDMCEEYGLAVEALDLLEHRNHPQDVDRMHEYRAMIKQMERDLKYELLAAYDPNRLRKD
jgi:hypothetical protein